MGWRGACSRPTEGGAASATPGRFNVIARRCREISEGKKFVTFEMTLAFTHPTIAAATDDNPS
jgi:hypothetical protein